MNNQHKALWFLAVMVMTCISGVALSSSASASMNLNSDQGLVDYLVGHDVVLSRVVNTCSDAKVVRTSDHGQAMFSMSALCAIRNNAEEDLDCSSYKVESTGTIDTATHATARKTTLSLQCSG